MTKRPYGYRAAILVLESLIVVLIAATGYWNIVSLRDHDRHVQKWLAARSNSDAVRRAVVAVEDERQALAGGDSGMFLQHARQCTDALHRVKLSPNTSDAALVDQILSKQGSVATQGDRLLSSPAAEQPAVLRLDQEIRNLLQLLQSLESRLPVTTEKALRHHDLMRGTVITVTLISLVTLSLVAITFSLLGRLSGLWAASQATAAAERVRADFVSFISHELRNSIIGLQSGVSLVLDEELPADTRRQVANAITSSVGALSRLVVNLLSADRAGRGRLQPKIQRVFASAAVAETVERMSGYQEDLRHRLQVHAPEASV